MVHRRPRFFAARGLALLALVFGQDPPAHATGAPPPAEEPAVALLSARVNGAPPGPAIPVLLSAAGEAWVRADDVAGWKIRYPPAAATRRDGLPFEDQLWVALDAVDHLAYRVDARRQELVVTAAVPALEPRRLAGREERFARPQPSTPGAFLNYDLTAQSNGRGSAVVELGAGFRDQVITSLFVAAGDGLERLETTWTLDRPGRFASWRIGDAVTGGGIVSRPLRFAGIQRSTNFRVRPDFVTYPLPALRGQASVPSVVELWVDGALRFHRQTPPGPFEISDPPLLNGSGTVDLVVRDLQGRERRISQPFHVSTELLRKGLVESSYQAGFVRAGFGTGDDAYGRFFLAGSYRRGLSDRLTSELHAQALDGQGTVGWGASFLAGRLGLFSLGLAWGSSPEGSGLSGKIAFEHRTRRLRLGVETLYTEPGFAELAQATAPKSRTRLHVGTSNHRVGSLAAGYLHQRPVAGPEIELVSLSFTRRLGDRLFLRLGAQRSVAAGRDQRWSIGISRSLGRRLVTGGQVRSEGGEVRTSVHLDRRPPRGTGIGFRVAAEDGPERRMEASAALKTRVGSYRLDLGLVDGRGGARLAASGALAFLGDAWAWTRRIDQSFAAVRVAGYPGVRVYADNQLVARTGARGLAFLPDLRPYRVNRVRIASDDLPLAARLREVEREVVPFEGGGLLLDFPVRVERGAVLRLVRETGEIVPLAAIVDPGGGRPEAAVGYDGEVYLPAIGAAERLTVRWPGGGCTAELELPPADEVLPVIGPVICRSG